jgi:hypothetical protein
MAISPQGELVWRGRLQLGDEPGVYGDASFAGLMLSIPFTVYHTASGGRSPITITLETEDAKTYSPYPGHEIALVHHHANTNDPQRWLEQVIATEYLNSNSNNLINFRNVDLASFGETICLSLRIRVDTSVPAGLYDDFVVGRLIFDASPAYHYYASLGFDSVT